MLDIGQITDAIACREPLRRCTIVHEFGRMTALGGLSQATRDQSARESLRNPPNKVYETIERSKKLGQ